MLSSHPASSERAQHIRDRLAAEKTAGKVVKPINGFSAKAPFG